MNLILAVLLPFLITTAEDQAASNIEVVEIFRVETSEELEAALTDGYPMPWLEEILSDESIPEEDRYWLDCRVRAVIAQDLHIFYDRNGNPVHVEAEWIAPGEDYWRENFMVSPSGKPFLYDSLDRPTNVLSEPGFLVNRFGEEIGQLAMIHSGIRLSRDASIGVTLSGRYQLPDCPVQDTSQLCFACILFSNGTFKEISIGFAGYMYLAISNDGNTIAVTTCVSEESPERSEGTGLLSIFNRNGEILHKYFMTNHPSSSPAVSANGRFVACQQFPVGNSGAFLINGNTGELLQIFGEDILGHYFFFTPNEKYLCIGGLQRPMVFDCEALKEIWTIVMTDDSNISDYRGTNCDNTAQVIAMQTFHESNSGFGVTIRCINEDDSILSETTRSNIQISPDGNFILSQSYDVVRPHFSLNGLLSIPLMISRLSGGE